MNYYNIAHTIVIYFAQNQVSDFTKYKTLSDELGMNFTDDEIKYGIDNIFFSRDKKWVDWEIDGGLGAKLYLLRMFAIAAMNILTNRDYLLECVKDEIYVVEQQIPHMIKEMNELSRKANIFQENKSSEFEAKILMSMMILFVIVLVVGIVII